MPSLSVAALLASAGANPLLQGIVIILATFVLEDAATVLAAMRVEDGQMAMPVALGALYVGIVLGDLGLYGLGWLAARLPWAARMVPPPRLEAGREWLRGRVFKVVFISRFIPGARLPTYTTCGFLGAGWRRFAAATAVATLIWTSLLFGLSLRVGALMIEHLGHWRWAGAVGFAVAIVLLGRTAARVQEARR
jgi:membrane protein DedA with SNARE-associated domain